MHIDFAHAAVSGVLILITLLALKTLGLRRDDRKWDWSVFVSVFVVMAVLNILWPYGSP